MSRITEKQRQARQQATQEAIYEAALEVMSRPDFEGLKMQDIASAVGIATGTLYNYFRNKEDLVYYVDERLKETVHAKVGDISADQGPADMRLRRLFDVVFDLFEKHHVVFDLAERFGVPERTPGHEKQAFVNQHIADLSRIIDEGIEQGCFRGVDVQRTAAVMFDALVGVCKRHKYLGQFDFDRSRRDVLGMFEDYLRVG